MVARQKNSPVTQPRALGALAAMAVIDGGRSLDHAIAQVLHGVRLSHADIAWTRELVYGVVRRFRQLDDTASSLLEKPLRRKDRDIYFLIITGIYQLLYMRTPEHAALSETVNGCVALGKPWAKKLVNGCLRHFLREGITIEEDSLQYSHPDWLADRISVAWPQHARTILAINNIPPPMCLRVNTSQLSRTDYLVQLQSAGIQASPDTLSAAGLVLGKGVSTDRLPGFDEGRCSVQDSAAQLAAVLLAAEPGHRVLDACSAPGGKTGHMLEHARGLVNLTAIDISGERLDMVRETLVRLGRQARCIEADAANVSEWWDGEAFDRILIDVPCSGTGVIRRHPDIRHHRRPDDIARLVERQSILLDAMWQILRPGGQMLYSTCSILPEENQQQITRFLARHSDAIIHGNELDCAIQCEPGLQTLPGVHPCDGFYYCLIGKPRQRP